MSLVSGVARRNDFAERYTNPSAVAKQRSREFAFVARNAANLVFVGTSTNPFARLQALRRDLGDEMELAYIGLVTGPVGEIRRHAWRALEDHDCGGRWYDVPADHAVGALHRAAFKLDGGLREVEQGEADVLLTATRPQRRDSPRPLKSRADALPSQIAGAVWTAHPVVERVIRAFTPTKFKVTAIGFLAVLTFMAIGLSAKY
jgi:hypothetical protein